MRRRVVRVSKSSKGSQGCLREGRGRGNSNTQYRLDPIHHDGGASVMVLTLTLRGCRRLKLYGADFENDSTEDPVPARVLEVKPLSVYMAPICTARHLVEHVSAPVPLMRIKGLGFVKVSWKSMRCIREGG